MIQINVTLIVQIINFLVLLLVLNALLYKPVIAKIREREARIRNDREKAAELDGQVQEQERRHQQELAIVRQTGAQEKNALTVEAKKKEAEILDKARAEASRIVEDMKASIRVEAEEVRKALTARNDPARAVDFRKDPGEAGFMKATKIGLILFFLFVALSPEIASASAAGAEEGPWSAWMLFWRVINTAALIGLLIYFVRKPLATFFSERKAQISKDLEEAKEQRDKAEALLAEYKQKFAGMEKELEKLRAELQKSADAESAKIMANAEKMSVSMVEAAKLAAEQEVRKARATLKNEAVAMAVQMAESLIREKINDADRKKIVEDYLVKVGGIK